MIETDAPTSKSTIVISFLSICHQSAGNDFDQKTHKQRRKIGKSSSFALLCFKQIQKGKERALNKKNYNSKNKESYSLNICVYL
jgi:hypothetical protein